MKAIEFLSHPHYSAVSSLCRLIISPNNLINSIRQSPACLFMTQMLLPFKWLSGGRVQESSNFPNIFPQWNHGQHGSLRNSVEYTRGTYCQAGKLTKALGSRVFIGASWSTVPMLACLQPLQRSSWYHMTQRLIRNHSVRLSGMSQSPQQTDIHKAAHLEGLESASQK